MMPGTVAAGVTMTARSMGFFTAPTFGNAAMPSTRARFRFTGMISPPKFPAFRFSISVRPTLPSASVAPITATDFGASIVSKAGRRSRNIS